MSVGGDAEGEWTQLMVRLRKDVGSRAGKSETGKLAEGRALLAPLLDELAQMCGAGRGARAEGEEGASAGRRLRPPSRRPE